MSQKVNIVTITVNGADINFEPNVAAYNKYVNEFMPANKVSPAVNYLSRIVCSDSKDALAEVITLPGAALQLADAVNEQFAPQLEITVKK
ncbi:putative phage tail assembly chaperone [Enterobacter ludwigii]|uniref:putative phage tail assembly chaperone n=1 Tax=Enterobacter ludwigii TaxID=299767 RepID=UPI003F6F3CA5